MHSGLSQKIGKAGDARPFANDVEEITMFTGRAESVNFPEAAPPPKWDQSA